MKIFRYLLKLRKKAIIKLILVLFSDLGIVFLRNVFNSCAKKTISREAEKRQEDQYSTKVGVFQLVLQLMMYRVPEALMGFLTLCQVSIFSNYLHFNYSQLLTH